MPLGLGATWEALGVPAGSSDHRLEGLTLRPCPVPGTAATATQAAGDESGARDDPDDLDWWFRCRFTAPSVPADGDVVLTCDGIATLADVWLNDRHVLATDNMHVAHIRPVSELLRAENELVIGVRALNPHLVEKRPRSRWRTQLVRNQNLRFVRTSLFGRIPAFAPGPSPVGPWRQIALVYRRHLSVDRLSVRTSVVGQSGIVRFSGCLQLLGNFVPETVSILVTGPSGSVEAPLTVEQSSGDMIVHGSVRLDEIELWWPHTHGAQPRYEVAMLAKDADKEVTIECGRVSFRTLSFEHHPGLAISVNEVPVFCRGGTLLPDAASVDPGPEALHSTLLLARDAGMNMIRLSGVGTYGSPALYEACDELGLLVWQDFPFANLDYPIEDADFRRSVEAEVTGFLSRVGHHPSLALLCGNSEIEQQVGMLGLDPQLGRGPLFDEILPRLAGIHTPDAHYLPSSPTGGDQAFRPNAGVAHYFGVGAYRRPLTDARMAEVRFASECLAFANVPDDDVLESLDPDGGGRLMHHPAWKEGVPRDTGAGWDFDDVRDHYLRALFAFDPAALRSTDPERYLRLSRVVTGELMAATLGEWRRHRSTCRGALLWTLNDVIPGAGWGVLDHRGRPKAAYWFVRRALAPIAVWLTDEGNNGVAVHVQNDRETPFAGTLEVALHRPDGLEIAANRTGVGLAPHEGEELGVEKILGRFADASYAFRFGPPEHDVVVARLLDDQGTILSESFFYPLGFPREPFTPSALGLQVDVEDESGETILTVRSARLAYAVSVVAPGFTPDDDYFSVAPGGTRRITLRPTAQGAAWKGATIVATNGDGTVRLGRSG